MSYRPIDRDLRPEPEHVVGQVSETVLLIVRIVSQTVENTQVSSLFNLSVRVHQLDRIFNAALRDTKMPREALPLPNSKVLLW